MLTAEKLDSKTTDHLKIGFDAKRAFFNRSGLGNYSRNLISALSVNYKENEYFLFTPGLKSKVKWSPGENCIIIPPGRKVFKFLGSLWRSKYITEDIVKSGVSIFHGLSHELPVGIEKTGVKSIVTIHDVIFLKYPGFYNKIDIEIYKKKLFHACRVADKIVAISEQTRKDLSELPGINPEKISVIYQGYNTSFLTRLDDDIKKKIRIRFDLPDRFLLYVGTIEERKNLLGLIKALHITGIKIPLVAIGRKVEPYFARIDSYIKAHNITNVRFIDTIENHDLVGFYQMAECFVYPSFYEGFGIPIIEALASKVPVITSKGGCFAEAGGPGTIYIDPADPYALGSEISKVLSDKELRSWMISQGKEFIKRFSNENIAFNYMKLYKSWPTT
ncbi:MAG TPA: glycosyltransferase family 1 protein [Bacteroidales bacterium]|nr:glycosyltransferase family 1 protein [Bacteroidales bacterium]